MRVGSLLLLTQRSDAQMINIQRYYSLICIHYIIISMISFTSQSLWIRSLGSLLRVSWGCNQGVNWAEFSSGDSTGENPLPSSFRQLAELIFWQLQDWGPLLPVGWRLEAALSSWRLPAGRRVTHIINPARRISRVRVLTRRHPIHVTQSVKCQPIPFAIFHWLEASHRFCSHSGREDHTRVWTPWRENRERSL